LYCATFNTCLNTTAAALEELAPETKLLFELLLARLALLLDEATTPFSDEDTFELATEDAAFELIAGGAAFELAVELAVELAFELAIDAAFELADDDAFTLEIALDTAADDALLDAAAA